ncbi:DUF1631 family protein [Parendozoicomonas haliclonae]|uniref:DUF1631 domain-containing protein n=1 Tax=Parendozoicomonas haliclonae TaxID=1960125 RepID=A0A1X7AEV6_9GAMM|nr:DUF1631 family protein [Parendozoicomonas haliclonae]SMA34473.1 hypothetical protein EHSB41UT_00398 [Parendozoicomonas haliclonae]
MTSENSGAPTNHNGRSHQASTSKVTHIHQRPADTTSGIGAIPNSRQLLEHCRRKALDALSECLDQTLTLTDDALFAQAENAQSNVEQTLYFDAMRDIRRNRSVMTRAFHSRLSEKFRQFPFGPNTSHSEDEPEVEPDEDNMTLLNTDAYEDTLQITSLSSRIHGHSHENLFGLEKRLAVLNHGYPLSEQDNPLEPKHIVSAFALALEPAHLHSRIKPDLYHLFEEASLEKLEALYSSINQFLIDQGILPNLRYTAKIQQAPQAAARKEHKAESADEARQTDQASTTQAPADIHTESQVTDPALFSALLHHFRHNTQMPAPKQAWSQEQLLSALTRLQKKALSGDYHPFTGQSGASAFRNALKHELAKDGQHNNLTPDDESSIHLIETLFDHITHDHSLPESYRSIMGQMALPWARLTLTDQKFLQADSHPARELLDTMAEAAEHFRDAHTFSRDLLKQSQAVIHALTKETQLRRQRCQDLLTYLQQQIGQLHKKADIIEKRQIEASKGQETLHNARIWARETIHTCPGYESLPVFSQRFLDTLWHDTLVFQYLRFQDAIRRKACRQLSLRLVQALSDNDVKQLDLLHNPVMHLLTQTDSLQPQELERLFVELKLETSGSVARLDRLRHLEEARVHDDSIPLEDDLFVPPATEAIISGLQPGIWCSALNQKGEERHWKLAWHSKNGLLFLFVDGAGQKTALVDKGKLGAWIMQGRLTPHPDGLSPLVQRTLLAIQKRVQKRTPGSGQ